MTRLVVHIDRLVLRGWSRAERDGLPAALAAALERLAGGTADAAPPGRPPTPAQQVAQAILAHPDCPIKPARPPEGDRP